MAPDNLYIVFIVVLVFVIGIDIYTWSRSRSFTSPEIRLQRFRSTVNTSIFILATTLTLLSISFHVNIFHYNRPIEYAHVNSITLENFVGYRRPNETLDGMNKFAFITTSIEWEKNENDVRITSLFHPSRSYVYNENLVNKFLLEHELYHFHIAEYFARESRKALSEHKEMPSGILIEEIVSMNKYLENEMQYRYDDETYHGYILKEQKRWKLKVDSLLALRQKYSNVKITYK